MSARYMGEPPTPCILPCAMHPRCPHQVGSPWLPPDRIHRATQPTPSSSAVSAPPALAQTCCRATRASRPRPRPRTTSPPPARSSVRRSRKDVSTAVLLHHEAHPLGEAHDDGSASSGAADGLKLSKMLASKDRSPRRSRAVHRSMSDAELDQVTRRRPTSYSRSVPPRPSHRQRRRGPGAARARPRPWTGARR